MSPDADGGLSPELRVGTLTRPHGVHGELRIRCSADNVEALVTLVEAGLPVTLLPPGGAQEHAREVLLESVRGHESAPIVAIEGVDDRDAAGELRGWSLAVPREALPELEEDEYRLGDLEGCSVVDLEGERLGEVVRAEAHPANVLLHVQLPGAPVDPGARRGRRRRPHALLVPFTRQAVPEVDVAGRRIVVDRAFLDPGIGEQDDGRG